MNEEQLLGAMSSSYFAWSNTMKKRAQESGGVVYCSTSGRDTAGEIWNTESRFKRNF